MCYVRRRIPPSWACLRLCPERPEPTRNSKQFKTIESNLTQHSEIKLGGMVWMYNKQIEKKELSVIQTFQLLDKQGHVFVQFVKNPRGEVQLRPNWWKNSSHFLFKLLKTLSEADALINSHLGCQQRDQAQDLFLRWWYMPSKHHQFLHLGFHRLCTNCEATNKAQLWQIHWSRPED